MICPADKKTKLIDIATADEMNTYMAGCPSLTLPPVADFTASTTSSCAGTISFSDLSTLIPTSWLWTFGDGQTSTEQNPTHTYASSGTYTVTLQATNAYGNNTATKSSYISVALPTAPNTTDGSGSSGSTVTLSATGAGTLNWFTTPTGGTSIFTGTSFVTPPLNSTTNYYVDDNIYDAVQSVGKTAIGNGTYYTATGIQGLKFNALKPLTIKSVTVYANTTADRTIWLKNSSGIILNTLTTNIASGQQNVTLNFIVPEGTGYVLSCDISNSLWRDSEGGVYPYTLPGIISITGNIAGSSAENYYYFFYNWQVEGGPCTSERSEVTANIEVGIDEQDALLNYSFYPNPNRGKFILNINSQQNQDIMVNVIDVSGKNVYSDQFRVSGELNKKFDFSDFSKGVYYMKIVSNNKVFNEKVIIE